MAESIARPWIAKHLLQIAETHGANIHDAPLDTKKRKIQITKFLTFNPNHQPNDIIWALISDKQYEIPVKFTAAAVTAYNKVNDVFGAADDERRLTTQRYAVAVVGNIKAFFARVPLGNGKGMPVDECIAFEIGEVRVLGAVHEGIFGNPANIETHEDIQEWVSGLRQGGGAGNVLKRERIQDAPTKPVAQQQTISLQEKNTVTTKETPVLRSSAVANLAPRKGKQSKAPSDKFKAYLRKWKEVERINSIPRPISVELQAQFDQILRFGQEVRGGEKRKPPILAYEKQTSESDYDDDGQQDAEVIRQASNSKGEVVTKPETTAPCEVKTFEQEEVINDSQESGPHQSTPSEWEDSEDEQLEPKSERDEVAGSISARQQSQRRSRSSSKESPSEHDEDSAEENSKDMDVVIDQSTDEESGNSDEGEDHSDRSSEEDAADEWFSGPTPAQRRKQAYGIADSSPSHSHIPSQPIPSQNGTSEMPSSLPVAAFPYHTSSKRSTDRSSIILPLATSQLTQSQPKVSQTSHLPPDNNFPSQEKSEGAPRILVPDSDTSGAQNSQSQSMSQSQSQRQINVQSQPPPQSNDSHPSQKLLHPSSSDCPPQNTTYSAVNATDQAERRLLVQSRSLTQPPKGTLTSHNKSQTASGMTSSQPQTNETTESRTQSETQPSHEEAIGVPERSTAIPVGTTNNAIPQLPPLPTRVEEPIQPQSGEQPSSVTQDDSQAIQSHTKSSIEIQGSVPVTQDLAEPETLASLDADDARTHALVFGSSTGDTKPLVPANNLGDPFTEPQRNGESSMQTSERDVIQPDVGNEFSAKRTARESFRLSRVQGSPSTHLGKHPRSSSPDLHSASLSSSATKEQELSHGRKKARTTSSASSAARKVVKLLAAHDSEAWKAPTFQQKRRKERHQVVQSRNGEDQDTPMASMDISRSIGKGKQRAVEPEPTLPSVGQSVTSETSVAGSQDHRGRSLGSSQTISSGNTTRTEQRSKSKGEQGGSYASSTVPGTSSLKPKGSATQRDKRPRLGGFTVDLTSRNELGRPKWLTWADAVQILRRIAEQREEHG